MRSGRALGYRCMIACALALGACDQAGPQEAEQGESANASLTALGDSDSAQTLLKKLRDRHQVAARSRPNAPAASPASATSPAARRSLLGPSLASGFRSDGDRLRPVFAKARSSEAADIDFPRQASGAFAVRELSSGVAVEARLVGANNAVGATAEGYVTYLAAGPTGGSVVHRVTESGMEDYVAFETRPAAAEIAYELALSPNVAGLRMVGNSLEMLDSSGNPRLRVAPPVIVGADGAAVLADLDVEGCRVDQDPTAPWDRPPVAPGAQTCTMRVRWDDSKVTYPALLDPAWSTTGSMSVARDLFNGAVLSNGRVLAVGGYDNSNNLLKSAELYDPSKRTWASTGSLATARAYHTATVRSDGRVLVTGGWGPSGQLASAEIYDSSTGKWSSAKSMIAARFDHRAVRLNNGDILVAAGYPTAAAEKFSNSSSTWSSAGALGAVQVTGASLTALSDGRALMVGYNAPQAQIYNPSNNSWSTTTSPSVARSNHTATLLTDGTVLVVGGSTDQSTEIYAPTAATWTRAGNTYFMHGGHTATRLSNGRVLVVGDYSGTSATASEVYNPTWGTWTVGPAMSRSRVSHIAGLLSSGKVLVAGGYSWELGAVLATAEEYDPSMIATTTTEYKLAASVDSTVLSDRATEAWASVTRPTTLTSGKRYPLLVFLHGNHETCGYGSNPRIDDNAQYTTSGTCPSGYVVVPSHRGYDYVAEELAARQYIVVSINANRGINMGDSYPGDDGLNLARGRLILKHLQLLSQWNRGATTTPSSIGVSLKGKLDLTQVGLMGHSRGGEGVRAAYNQYRDTGSAWPGRIVDPVTFRGIFEVGPVDGQTSRILNADNTKWNVLLPMCDGDVSDLEGVLPFDRMMGMFLETNVTFKSTYTVWGANHNFFNTQWQQSDSWGCTNNRAIFSNDGTVTGSAEERQAGLEAMLAFFQANVGGSTQPSLNDWFNPEQVVQFEPRVDRGYTPGLSAARSMQLEDFTQDSGTSSFGLPNDTSSNMTVTHGPLPEHDGTYRAGNISWDSGDPSTYFQTNFDRIGMGFDLRNYALLDFRIDRPWDDLLNPIGGTCDVRVQLVNSDNSLSSMVSVSDYVSLQGPVGGPYSYHAVLQTVRIPLTLFSSANLASIRGVRFSFPTDATGRIYLGNVRATVSTEVSGPIALVSSASAAPSVSSSPPGAPLSAIAPKAQPAGPIMTTQSVASGNAMVALRSTADGTSVEVELSSPTPFKGRGTLLTLVIGKASTGSSRYVDGDLKHIIFTLPRSAFDALQGGEPISVQYGRGRSDIAWDFGSLDKSRLTQ